MRPLTTQDTWDSKHPASIKHYPKHKLYRADREISAAFHPLLEQKRGGALLEMGCGDSCWLPYFAKEYGFTVAGLDFSQERLDRTQTNLMLAGVQGDLVCGDFTKQDSTPREWLGAFDIVYSGGVVEHFDHPELLLRRFSRYLKPDGIMITTVPHLKGFWGRMQTRINQESGEEYRRLNLEEVRQMHLMAGFRIIDSRYFRWMDAGVLNFTPLHPVLRFMSYGAAFGINTVVGALFRLVEYGWLPESLYSDMIVGAKKNQ